MTKEELIQFLKENLRVTVADTRGMYDDHPHLTVSLYIGDECISSDFEYLY
jgi:hypothetical protein